MHKANWVEDILIPKLFTEGRLKYAPPKFKIHSIAVQPLAIDGFMLTAPIRVEVDFGGSDEKISLIVKKTPEIPEMFYAMAQFNALFGNEEVAYEEILPLLSQAGKYPKLFYVERQPTAAVCALDDFACYGWKTSTHLYNLPLEYLLLAVREIAGFHGEMYALKHTDPDRFHGLTAKLKESRWAIPAIPPSYLGQIKGGMNRALVLARKHSDIPADFIDKLAGYTADPLATFRRCVAPREPLATICHGDYLRNNIAFKYQNEQPIDAMMYDFQTMRYASPMMDLTILLQLSAFHEVRSTHFSEIFRLYHDTLIERYCGSGHVKRDVCPEFMALDEFLIEYYRLMPYAMLISGSFLRLLVEPFNPEVDGDVWDGLTQTEETMFKDAMKRGGKVVDDELLHQVQEFYELFVKFGKPFEV